MGIYFILEITRILDLFLGLLETETVTAIETVKGIETVIGIGTVIEKGTGIVTGIGTDTKKETRQELEKVLKMSGLRKKNIINQVEG